MAAHISREEYLKRYLSGENTTDNVKKKRRKKKQVQANDKILPRSTIVDDDVDFNSLLPENIENTLEEDVGDNDPTVAEFIDERPEHVKQLENYRHNERWTILGKSADKKEFFVLNQSDSDGVESPVHRNQRHDSDSDQSPPRRQNNNSDSDQSPPRRKRKDSDSDQSPPRKHRKHDSDSDQSPPRKHRKHDSDSDQSPPRKHRKHDSDSDQSPPRRKSCQSAHKDYKLKNIEEEKRHSKQSVINKDSDPDVCRKRSKCEYGNSKNVAKPTKTLGGAKAGLSSAKEMRAEADKIKSKEEDAFKKIGASKLGRDTITVFRDKSGRKRNLREEQEKQSEEDARKAEEIEKYKKWGQGLKQREEQQKSLTEAIHEASKPLARYKDDDDLDEHLRNMERSEDPMLAFIKKKKSKESNKPEKPRYKGPMPPPNRYNIMPGYRWDGVNRSNGFEAKIFSKIAEQKAMKSMAYKWSVEEM